MIIDLNEHDLEIAGKIKNKIIEIAKKQMCDANDLQFDDIIPATGYLDSLGLMELIVWYEAEFVIEVAQSELNIDNFGSISLMVEFFNKNQKK